MAVKASSFFFLISGPLFCELSFEPNSSAISSVMEPFFFSQAFCYPRKIDPSEMKQENEELEPEEEEEKKRKKKRRRRRMSIVESRREEDLLLRGTRAGEVA
jgi:hypothetical protein